ncbi:50S ribosomal protein L10 [Patescibacteria group bacterium]|nr:50S ribosomal protein L10 [Patescibacteria group bacterium]MBU1673409.1 50S ribosomal protein L10 [Patescibacteria group bacterium]MBU1963313.1 50S ribosomal protein L10 [Patescibacteria group bacterium]
MPKTRKQKEEVVDKLTKDLEESKGVVFSTYMGLTVFDMEELRNLLHDEGAQMSVVKKTLLKRALEKAGFDDVDMDQFDSGVAVTTADDEVVSAKTLAQFGKKHELVTFFGGIMENKFIDGEKVTALSVLPSKEELYAKIVGSINAPVSGFVNVLAGNLRNLVGVLGAIKDTKE